MKKVLAFAVVFLAHISVQAASTEPMELYWEDLIPEGFELNQPLPEIDHNNPMAQANPNAPVRGELSGKTVKIPGFVVPLEGDDDKITEFLLVPFFGACIHVPPPPSNQIVHVNFPGGAGIDSLYDAIWVTGKLGTEGWSGDLATVGYTLVGTEITPFE